MTRPNIHRTFSVLIIDDHPVVRGGMEALLRSEKGIHILACAASGHEALEICQKAGVPDVALLDVRMPDFDGFQTLHLLRKHFPDIRILMIAGMPLRHEAERAREMGARGYVSKSADQATLLKAIFAACADDARFVKTMDTRPHAPGLLSPREIEVLEYLSRGLSREDIGKALNISAETVKSHVKAILIKLDAAGRTEAVTRGYELGLLHI